LTEDLIFRFLSSGLLHCVG